LAEANATTGHQVRLLPGGECFDCAADVSILSAAHAANILISYSCRSGQCGSCIGRVLSGEITYPHGFPDAISAAEGSAGYVLFCSAHATSDLEIELLPPPFNQDPDPLD
jgi:CDP-4-dehydro-6-deoxyglucose reductase